MKKVNLNKSTRSFNNRLIVENYKKEALRSNEKNGFAFVDQRTSVKGLKVLADAQLNDGTLIAKGSIAYIKEEQLHTQPWAQKAFQCPEVDGSFLIIDLSFVELVVPPGE